MNEKETYVHLSGSTNSTMFTDCCDSAVTERDTKCPSCGALVYPVGEEDDHKRATLRWQYAFKKPQK